jgi:hypothetical protein
MKLYIETTIQAGIIPLRFKNDGLHVAVAVCHELDVLVSWNMVHLVNVGAGPNPNSYAGRNFGLVKHMGKLKLPEPKAVREVHRWRERIQKRAEKIGWDNCLQQIHSRPRLFADAEPMVLNEGPKKYRASHKNRTSAKRRT